MKIQVSNLGVLKEAQFELSELTIICGKNNTGKTYATYALYGLLYSWESIIVVKIPQDLMDKLWDTGFVSVHIDSYLSNAQNILDDICDEYQKKLSKVFASKSEYFEDTTLRLDLEGKPVAPLSEFNMSMGTGKKRVFKFSKKADSPFLDVTLLTENDVESFPEFGVRQEIGRAIQLILFKNLLPNPFIASAERTGAAIFRKELDFARNRLLEQMKLSEKDFNPFELLDKFYSDYALPVRNNVDFLRQLEDVSKNDSFISRNYPDLTDRFHDIIGGEYKVKSEELYFVPNSKKQLKLTMDESSSSVRSLLDIGFYLRHVAEPGDLLMVDEPELNLHPENQRRLARLFARLVNIGIKVFMTTHSDYIIKEFNTLIMFNRGSDIVSKIMESYGYEKEETLNHDSVRLFMAKESRIKPEKYQRKIKAVTLIPANIDPDLGIEAPTFDESINEMNEIQEAIIFSDEE